MGGGGAETTCSVLVRPVRSLAEDSGSGLACASTFGPRCACLGSSESNFQKRGQFAGGAIRQRAAFKVCEVPSANDVLARPPFFMPPEVAFWIQPTGRHSWVTSLLIPPFRARARAERRVGLVGRVGQGVCLCDAMLPNPDRHSTKPISLLISWCCPPRPRPRPRRPREPEALSFRPHLSFASSLCWPRPFALLQTSSQRGLRDRCIRLLIPYLIPISHLR